MTLDPAGPAAVSIATLWWAMLAGAAVLFVLVMALFALVILRPGWGARLSPARWIVVGGLCLPAVVLTPLVAYALITGERLLPPPTPPTRCGSRRRVANGFGHSATPEYGGIKTEGVLHLPAGVPVAIVVTSVDVIHAFWIPRLAGMLDAVPGHTNILQVQAKRPWPLPGDLQPILRSRSQQDALRRHRSSGGENRYRDRPAPMPRERHRNDPADPEIPVSHLGAGRFTASSKGVPGSRPRSGSALRRSTIPSSAYVSWRRLSCSSLSPACSACSPGYNSRRRKRPSWTRRPTTRSSPCTAR